MPSTEIYNNANTYVSNLILIQAFAPLSVIVGGYL